MREGIATVLLLFGVAACVISVTGVFRFRYVLNRMHAAAIADTLGFGLIVFALVLHQTSFLLGAKIICVLLFSWVANPIATHTIAKLEVMTKPDYQERMKQNDAMD